MEGSEVGMPIQVLSNFFAIHFKDAIIKYSIMVESDLSVPSEKYQLILKSNLSKSKANREIMSSTLGSTAIILNGAVYSTRICTVPVALEVDPDNAVTQEFAVKSIQIQQESRLDKVLNYEVINQLMGRFFKTIMKKIRLKQVGRKMFDPSQAVKVNSFEIWPGYSSSLVLNSKVSLVNVDVASKIITNKFLNMVLGQYLRNNQHDIENVINRELVGKSVMTIYNKRFYIIDGVATNMNARSTFTNAEGVSQSFMQYYLEKYKLEVRDPDFPLLISKDRKTKQVVYLIPEFCVITGLSEEERADRNLMKDLDMITKPTGNNRLRGSVNLLNMITSNEASSAYLNDWRVEIDKNPLPVNAVYIRPGNLLFQNNVSVDIEKSQNLDRDTQQKFYRQKNFDVLVVFFASMCRNDAQTFMATSKDVFQQYEIICKDMKQVEVDFRNINNVKQAIQNNLVPGVTACVWILPGPKKNGQFYKEIKTQLINGYPVPSQMVISKTIGAGKNLRSIVTKIYIQICAKIGGVPWAINDLPFCSKPTMVLGMCHYRKSGSKLGIYSVVATTNPVLSTYWSKSMQADSNCSYGKFLEGNLTKAFETFWNENNVLPEHVICLREGVSKGEEIKVKEDEIDTIRRILLPIYKGKTPPKIIYVLLSRSTNAKFFLRTGQGDNLQNPNAGTYLHERVSENENEFFLIAQKPRIGMSSPCGYLILENDLSTIDKASVASVRGLLAKLIYKLCYLYYNTTGSIKVPAPIHYADKLATFIGDKSMPNNPIVPHEYLGRIKSLFFI